MPILRINARPDRLSLHHGAQTSLRAVLRAALSEPGPVIVMVHGYKYEPGHARRCPHRSLFATDATRGAQAWPRHLGFGRGLAEEGVAIAFGWAARGSLPSVYRRASGAGRRLAELITDMRSISPDRPIHLMAHSMGSEVVFEALIHLPAESVSRIVILTGASFRSTAERAITSPAGRSAELLNVTSRENDLFDFLFERLVPAPQPGDRALGHGLWTRNATTVQLDHPGHLAALAQLGHPIGPAHRRICHWSGYLRPGVLRVWAQAMRNPEQLPLARLAPTPPAPRWSRIISPSARKTLLPDPATPAT